MKVLWLSVTPSLFDEQKIGGWIASLERIVNEFLSNEIDLGVAFEYSSNDFKIVKNGTTYYPFTNKASFYNELKNKYDVENRWKLIKPSLLRIIEDFKPDIIHCFGSEWTYGAVVNEVNIPVVVHMQGFLNVYEPCALMSYSYKEKMLDSYFNPIIIAKYMVSKKRIPSELNFEKSLMRSNKFFMGRTNWDNRIVKYYSPKAEYYYCAEAIRPEIYNSQIRWKYNARIKKRFITITQANDLKGNEIILRTAQYLKEMFDFDFEWRVAGRKESFIQYEKKTGIRHEDVSITLLGMISPDEIVRELSEAILYIHPAIIDNSPNSLCEAQIIGCPVVATNVGGIPQLVEHGKTGFLYPYNEFQTLAFIIKELIDNEELLTYISKNETRAAEERHSPKDIAERILEVYQSIIKKFYEGEI